MPCRRRAKHPLAAICCGQSALAAGRVPLIGGRQSSVTAYLTCAGLVGILPVTKTTVSAKGQIVRPSEIRRQDAVEPGQEFTIERLDRGEYRLVRLAPPPNEGLVDWLLACPEKGYFVPIESESTDTL